MSEETKCSGCNNTGQKTYSSTSTWREGKPGFLSGMMMTDDVCDICWGSGDEQNPGINLREHGANLDTQPIDVVQDIVDEARQG